MNEKIISIGDPIKRFDGKYADDELVCRHPQCRMIVHIVSSSRARNSGSARRLIKVVLSSRNITTILLGLIISNCILILRHLSIDNLICFGVVDLEDKTMCSNQMKIERNERHFPRLVFYFENNITNSIMMSLPKRHVNDMGNAKARRKIEARDDVDVDIPEYDGCQLQYAWQKMSFPTCNTVHEFDGTTPWSRILNRRQKLYRIIGNGFWRDVWIINDDNGIHDEKGILKTMRYHHLFTPRNFDRMRRDSVTMERLTKSPYIVNIYSFCGTTSVTEFGDGGDIPDALWPSTLTSSLSQIEKLRIATQAAIALATVHNIDQEGYPTIAHTDISPAQYIKVNGTYKLNDFNRARFIAYKDNRMCPYSVGSNPGKNRSPEEYNYEPQTEKVDVYSLGNIFYMLLQGEWPFNDVPLDIAYNLVKNGTRPSVYADVWYSDNPVDIALKEAMIMCHEQNATIRASAREVEKYLMKRMSELDPEHLKV